MASVIGKYAAKRLMNSTFKKYAKEGYGGQYDPLFHEVDDPRHAGRKKKVKKQIPAYIPEHDAIVLAKVRKMAYRMDMSLFHFLGTRFGWSGIIGLVPVAGDVLDALISLWLIQKCRKVQDGLPAETLLMMLTNLAIDFGLGVVPVLGDLADAHFKCNSRNVRLLEKLLDRRHKEPVPTTDDGKKMMETSSASGSASDSEQTRRRKQAGAKKKATPPASVIEDLTDDERHEHQQ